MSRILNKLELLLLALLAAAIALKFFGTNIPVLYTISLAGLAIVFFLFAQVPASREKENTENRDFKSLLGLTILPKILWISTAVTTTGILFVLQDFAGGTKMLTIGGATIAIATVILIVLRFMNISGLEKVILVLYRSYPALLAAAYLLFV